MITEARLLEEVVVRAGVPIRMRGDTLEYTADSFALKPNSSVEELLKRLPGIQVERDGKIMAQGQEVKKVLVDGDEFFSDDPGLALKYLQSGSVDKVQVFDQKSEQAQFTGIDDGTRNKTINLKLKRTKRMVISGSCRPVPMARIITSMRVWALCLAAPGKYRYLVWLPRRAGRDFLTMI
ncbi:hypothetical protein [Paraflavitalea speifideaquila]|uniref:hypothetical protein n=1 Tax=Paraflavitalea speifideaquila TaxID=3076558 RepID=UPI0028EB0319|nr:hypothetical protein [Paraflavitalea speifideiaquila]